MMKYSKIWANGTKKVFIRRQSYSLDRFDKRAVKNYVINIGKKWTLQMLIPQYPVLVLKLSPIHTVSLNTVFSIL